MENASTPDCKERNDVLLNVRLAVSTKRPRLEVGGEEESPNRRWKQPRLIRSDSGRRGDERAGAVPPMLAGRSIASYGSFPKLQKHALPQKAFLVDVTVDWVDADWVHLDIIQLRGRGTAASVEEVVEVVRG